MAVDQHADAEAPPRCGHQFGERRVIGRGTLRDGARPRPAAASRVDLGPVADHPGDHPEAGMDAGEPGVGVAGGASAKTAGVELGRIAAGVAEGAREAGEQIGRTDAGRPGHQSST